MEKLLTKHLWVLNLITLATVAYLLAGGVGQLAAATAMNYLQYDDLVHSKPTIIAASEPSPLRTPDGSGILERNIFDSAVGPILPGGNEDEVAKGDDIPLIEGDLPVVPCPDGRYALLAAVSSSKNPEWSFATVSIDRQTQLYRIGDPIGEREVSGISWRYLFLRGTADECYVDMFDDRKSQKPKSVKRPTSKADIKKGIRVDGPNERTVDRAVVDAALANPAQFARSVRVRPFKKDGQVQGFRLRRVKKGSPIELLGAKRGDIIHAVNGVALNSVDQALAAYQNLRRDSRLQFDITRRGKPQTININIR